LINTLPLWRAQGIADCGGAHCRTNLICSVLKFRVCRSNEWRRDAAAARMTENLMRSSGSHSVEPKRRTQPKHPDLDSLTRKSETRQHPCSFDWPAPSNPANTKSIGAQATPHVHRTMRLYIVLSVACQRIPPRAAHRARGWPARNCYAMHSRIVLSAFALG